MAESAAQIVLLALRALLWTILVPGTVAGYIPGRFLRARSLALLAYWAIFFIVVNLFVQLYEEPTLRRQFGASYERYTERGGRWLPRRN